MYIFVSYLIICLIYVNRPRCKAGQIFSLLNVISAHMETSRTVFFNYKFSLIRDKAGIYS